ncbi:hypothetical protein L195_g049842, partial [Trifolium pratense]
MRFGDESKMVMNGVGDEGDFERDRVRDSVLTVMTLAQEWNQRT